MPSTMGCRGPQTMRLACLLLLLFACVHVMASSATAEPVSMVASTSWYGDDGQWGTVYIAVGDNPQVFAVLPNTAGVDILAVDYDGGCVNVSSTFCSTSRGGVFRSINSTTWESDGTVREADYNGVGTDGLYATYGTDYITFNLDTENDPDNSIGASSNISSAVATFNDTDNWIGYIGLNAYRTGSNDWDLPTFMESIWDNRSAAPSCSYGYTAGAYYRLTGAPASLTIGGVDELRFEPNDVSFNLSYQGLPVVLLSSVEVLSVDADRNSTTTSLLEALIDSYFTLDSSTSYIWLPEDTCDMFSQALNLTYNETLELYTYPAGGYDDLASSNISFTFSLNDTSSALTGTNITLPFSAFDHNISYPYPNFDPNETTSTLPYFPIKRASNSNDYRIGRVFFQEAYLIVDYERQNFSVYQASFDPSIMTNTSIVSIDPPPDSVYPGEDSDKLSRGAMAGIVIGSVAGFALIIFIIWWFFFHEGYQLSVSRREPKPKDSKEEISVNQDRSLAPRRWKNWRYKGRAELGGDHVQPSELPTMPMVHELPGSMPGTTDQPTTPGRKQNVRRSASSAAGSSAVSFSSSARTSVSSDGSFDEEELVSPQANSRPSSTAKNHFLTADEVAEKKHASETEANQRTRTLPGEIVLGPSASTDTSTDSSDCTSESSFSS